MVWLIASSVKRSWRRKSTSLSDLDRYDSNRRAEFLAFEQDESRGFFGRASSDISNCPVWVKCYVGC